MLLRSLIVLVACLGNALHARAQSGQREVHYTSGANSLAATLSIPDGPGPFPGVVLVHGSGTSSRSNPWTAAYANALLARGIAVLHPDKRGSGASGGDWRDASLPDLADDALAGLALLRDHPGVDSSRVGLIGFSQGGHVVPIAAMHSSDVAFVVNVSGSVVPMLEQIGDELQMMGEREGLSPEELATVARIHEASVRYIGSDTLWQAYADALAEAKVGSLGSTDVISGFPTEPDASVWAFLRRIGNEDPLLAWRQVSVPSLFLYGGRDENVDVFKSAARIETELSVTDVPYALLMFRNNGHALYREDAMDFIGRWIQDGGGD